MTPEEAAALNRLVQDERAPAHADSPDYGFARPAADPAHLSDGVRFDRPRQGDVTGLRGLHLQCHIGTDTVSLSRLGALMTGLDLSTASVAQARRLVGHPYSETPAPLLSTEDGTDVQTDVGFRHTTTETWNHGLGAIVTRCSTRDWR